MSKRYWGEFRGIFSVRNLKEVSSENAHGTKDDSRTGETPGITHCLSLIETKGTEIGSHE